MRPLLELLEGQAKRAGQAGLSSGQKALAAHLFEVIINEVSSVPHFCDVLQYVLSRLLGPTKQLGYRQSSNLHLC